MTTGTVAEAAQALRDGTTSSAALVSGLLERAAVIDPLVGSYLARFDDAARAAAARADDDLRAGRDRGPLQGIPIAVKDNVVTREQPATAQSRLVYDDFHAGADAPVVARLRDAGAVVIGKTTTNEYAKGPPDPAAPFPLPRNPWDPHRWTGGSSSGSANGVAAELFPAALGSDTGGSIRIPAAMCGVTGLRPTFGRVPRTGVLPLGYSLDAVGPLAHTARDCAHLLAAIAGAEHTDRSTPPVPVPAFLEELDGDLAGVRVGVSSGAAPEDADPGVAPAFTGALETFAAGGAIVDEVTLPHEAEVAAAGLLVSMVDAPAFHGRALRERWSEFGPGTRMIFAQGALFSGIDYVRAQRVRAWGADEAAALLRDRDVLVAPTLTIAAPRFDVDFFATFVPHMRTSAWSAVGFPVASIPMGFTADGLPLGMQVVGRPWQEATVLRVADAYQRRTDWHLRRPPLKPDEARTAIAPR